MPVLRIVQATWSHDDRKISRRTDGRTACLTDEATCRGGARPPEGAANISRARRPLASGGRSGFRESRFAGGRRDGLIVGLRAAATDSRGRERSERIGGDASTDLSGRSRSRSGARARGDDASSRSRSNGPGFRRFGSASITSDGVSELKPLSLTSRVAVVTGGTSGIGLALTRGLAEAGAGVVPRARRR